MYGMPAWCWPYSCEQGIGLLSFGGWEDTGQGCACMCSGCMEGVLGHELM